ncbi:MAG: hypothetical protein R3C01_08855 [Planctomycetaceae bacterium]
MVATGSETGRPSPPSLRSRVIGGTALGILAVGLWLGSYLKGPGLGTTTGDATTGDQKSGTTVEGSDNGSPVTVSTDLPAGAKSSSPARNLEVLPIHVRKDRYAVPSEGTIVTAGVVPDFKTFVEVPLSEVIELARSAPGNSYGTKVLIYISNYAVAENQQQLNQRLIEAGLDESSVKRESGYFD